MWRCAPATRQRAMGSGLQRLPGGSTSRGTWKSNDPGHKAVGGRVAWCVCQSAPARRPGAGGPGEGCWSKASRPLSCPNTGTQGRLRPATAPGQRRAVMLQKSSARLLRFGRYTNICLKEAQEWREICCLGGFWKEVERYTIIKISVVVPLAKL